MKLKTLALSLAIASLSVKSIECLLWSQFTLVQVVCCISWPIPFKDPQRKIFFNIGFQSNYGLPFRLSSFYNPPFFPPNNKRSNEGSGHPNATDEAKVRERKSATDSVSGRDVSAGEFYESVEENIVSAGYHRSCLEKSICELATHPFHFDEDEHLLAEVIHFLLTPSEHKAFSDAEEYQRDKYQAAEEIGRKQEDCDKVYHECDGSPLDQISTLANTVK